MHTACGTSSTRRAASAALQIRMCVRSARSSTASSQVCSRQQRCTDGPCMLHLSLGSNGCHGGLLSFIWLSLPILYWRQPDRAWSIACMHSPSVRREAKARPLDTVKDICMMPGAAHTSSDSAGWADKDDVLCRHALVHQRAHSTGVSAGRGEGCVGAQYSPLQGPPGKHRCRWPTPGLC